MEAKKILGIIEQIYDNDNYKKIFINGPWGIGKSYYANKFSEDNPEKCILYTSLFGKSSIEDIEDDINKQIINKINGIAKHILNIKKTIKNGSKNIDSISIAGIGINTSNFGRKFLLEKFVKNNIEKSVLIIIDDIERKSDKISIIDIMGFIESTSLLNKIKIVLIGDLEKLNDEEQEKWNSFKEKLIDKEYKIDSFSNEAFNSLVLKRISEKYIDKNELENLITSFFKKHTVKNLRSINKSINLFNEIIENYLENKNNKNNNLIILKNCLAVVIDDTEKLYKPKDTKEGLDSIEKEIYKDTELRILSNYFNAVFMNTNDSKILNNIIEFYNNRIDEENIIDFNKTLDEINKQPIEEKNIFYLSEEEIKIKIEKTINSIENKTYSFKTIKEFLNDIYEIFTWNKALELNYDEEKLYEIINNEIIDNYYSIEKTEYQNKIDQFYIFRNKDEKIRNVINNYNADVENRYITDKLSYILKKYNSKDFQPIYLEYFHDKLMQRSSEFCEEEFHKLCKNNNYLFPDLSKEIDDNIWAWTHEIWDIYREYMNNKEKEELTQFAKNKISTSNSHIEKYRIEALLEVKPLI